MPSQIPDGMKLIIAVVEDLLSFAVESLGGRKKIDGMSVDHALLEGVRRDSSDKQIRLYGNAFQYYQGIEPQKNTVMYVASTETPLRSEPTILRDTVIGSVPYGSMVMVLEVKNGWSRVLKGRYEGWVETRDLADKAAHILPQFVIGERNEAEDPNTVRLRAIIHDEFSGGGAGLPLQSHEYVLYKLTRKDLSISWPLIRPRKPGTWCDILKDTEGVTISAAPDSGSIIEFLTKENIGHLAYVEAVFPDGSIQISEANWPDDGIYNERVLVKNEWQELLPQFIKVS